MQASWNDTNSSTMYIVHMWHNQIDSNPWKVIRLWAIKNLNTDVCTCVGYMYGNFSSSLLLILQTAAHIAMFELAIHYGWLLFNSITALMVYLLTTRNSAKVVQQQVSKTVECFWCKATIYLNVCYNTLYWRAKPSNSAGNKQTNIQTNCSNFSLCNEYCQGN